MFRQRTSAQKPGDDLLAEFRQQFPEITTSGPSAPAAGSRPPLAADSSVHGQPGAQERHETCISRHHSATQDAFRDQDPTPRASGAEWRFTPSLLDHNTFSFGSFANQPPGFYTPTPGGTNTLYHPQAGDLHTPSLGLAMGLTTPLSLPTSDGAIHAGHGMMDMSHFQPALPPQFHQPFSSFIQPAPQQPAFPPSSLVHLDTGYETMDHDGSPLGSDGPVERIGSMDGAFHPHSPPGMGFRQFGVPMAHALPSTGEKFRFHCTLNAPTAMIKHAEEIPVTYLNKGQAYSLSIVDTSSTSPAPPGTKFRTYIRISFEDEQQRQKPGVCWSLWKEGRGTNEAHHRGGKLQAVEYVEAGQPVDADDRRTRVELESASFDGFCVTWTPSPNGVPECSIAFRSNFLSTDFSHSKGVKGIPVRLCAKTSVISTAESLPPDPFSEICYCKVKLFRDHGAERKLSNDIAHVKKTVDKLRQQISQAENGGKDFGKRKRGGAHIKSQDHQRPGKTPKHKRTWSMSSVSSADGGSGGGANARPSLEDDLNFKLQTLQEMFSSTHPVSILYLRGKDLDDPDLHPVSLPGESADLSRVDSRDSAAWQARSARNSVAESSLVSPSPSSASLQSQATGAAPWVEKHRSGDSHRLSDQPTKIKKTDDAGNISGWIDAVGIDPTYKPPVEKLAKPIACFYIARKDSTTPEERKLYRAVYLSERSMSNFISRAAAKWNLDPARVTRTVHVLGSGLEVEMDNDVIHELSEGQDMVLEVVEVDLNVPQSKPEWELMAVDGPEGDGKSAHSAYRTTTVYELRFTF
ncbi:CP2 transcription factor-domain-containing protein [Xylaria telfairii]|nr:CP2 transcription factor-domain-containing protein [Xylaria telfairii]